MAYSSANTEILAYTGFTNSYSTGTSPTLDQVTSIITMIDGEIDSALYALGITTTPTNTALLAMLKKYSAMGSAGLVLQRYKNPNAENNNGDWLYTKYETWIDKLLTDDDYKAMIKEMGGTPGGYDGIYVSSNVDDGTHEGATPASTTISYGVEGFEI